MTYDAAVHRYLLKGRFSRYLFLEGEFNSNISGEYFKDRSRSHYLDEYEMLNSEREKKTVFLTKTSLFPSVGCGKRLPVKPVHTAFEIERNLRKLNALKSNLSDSTILHLAALCGSFHSFRLKHERPDKFIMSSLDSILRDDPALDTANYDAFSLFKVYETLTERFFLLFHGFEIRIRPEFYFGSDYVSWLTPEEDSLLKSRGVEFMLDFNSPIQFAWTFPVSSRFFVEYIVSPPYFADDNFFLHFSSLKLYYFLTNRILLDFSVNDISTFLIVPKGKPGNILFSALFFLEDKLTLQLSAEKRFRSSQSPLP